MTQTFLVLGAGHSGTSTLSGIINTSSRALCLFEVDFTEGRASKYRSRYQTHFDDWDYLFGTSRGIDWSLRELLKLTGHSYTSVGTKIQELRFDLLDTRVDRTFCTVRHPRSWLSHPSAFRSYAMARGFLHVAIDYVLFIDAAIRSGATLFSLEALYRDPTAWHSTLEKQLEGFNVSPESWWEKMEVDDRVKQSASWLRAHRSSERMPEDFRPQLAFTDHPDLQQVFAAFDSMETDDHPRRLSKPTRDSLNELRTFPTPPAEQLLDTSQPLFLDLNSPPTRQLRLIDLAYSRVFGKRK